MRCVDMCFTVVCLKLACVKVTHFPKFLEFYELGKYGDLKCVSFKHTTVLTFSWSEKSLSQAKCFILYTPVECQLCHHWLVQTATRHQLHIIIWLTVFVLELLKWYFFKISGYTFAFKKHLRSLWSLWWYEVKKSLLIVIAKTETKKLQEKISSE